MSDRKTSGPRSSVTVIGNPLRQISGTVSVAGITLLATPPQGQRIVIANFVIQNESNAATTMTLMEGGLDRYRYLGQNQGDSLSMVFSPGYEWRLGADAVLNFSPSGANQCNYSLAYFTEKD